MASVRGSSGGFLGEYTGVYTCRSQQARPMLPAAGAVGFDSLGGLGKCMYIFVYVHRHICFFLGGDGSKHFGGGGPRKSPK
jgi:hypothetical protein